MKHADLIDRLNAGSGPDNQLCADIYCALDASAEPARGTPGWVEICGDPTHVVNVSGLVTSLDACIGLMREVLPGCSYQIEKYPKSPNRVYLYPAIGPTPDGGEHEELTRALLIAILQAVGEAG